MSSNRHQRKQELLDTLALSRLEMLDRANEVSLKVDKTLSLPGKIGKAVMDSPGILVTTAGVSGLVLYKIVTGLVSHRHSRAAYCPPGMKTAARQGLLGLVFSSLWGMIISAAAPVIRENVQGLVRHRLSNLLPPKK